MSFHCGIVGLPNVGKSTLFNALTQTQAAEAANYPFCTIEPNIGRVAVPDARLTALQQLYHSAKVIPAQMEFVDIAGLVKGAAQGEGLGNQFLGHIRGVDAVAQVVRCFEDSDITHVSGRVDPINDIATINTELLLADIEWLEKRKASLEKKAKGGDEMATVELAMAEKILPLLSNSDNARQAVTALQLSKEASVRLDQWPLLSLKPMMLVCNLSEAEVAKGNDMSRAVVDYAKKNNLGVALVSAKIEAEIALLPVADQADYLTTVGLSETGLKQIIRLGYRLLDRLSFFTAGPKETRGWSVNRGATAQEAAGTIHTDFARGFIAAETIHIDDLIAVGSEQKAKEQGKVRLEGKNYIVQDGDVFHFRFAV